MFNGAAAMGAGVGALASVGALPTGAAGGSAGLQALNAIAVVAITSSGINFIADPMQSHTISEYL